MGIKGAVPACLALLLTMGAAVPSRMEQVPEKSGGPNPMDLKHLGTVDGIAYFYDDSSSGGWAEASANCQEANMRLATVKTENQFDFLLANLTSTAYDYWTAGRGSIVSLLSGIDWNSMESTDQDSSDPTTEITETTEPTVPITDYPVETETTAVWTQEPTVPTEPPPPETTQGPPPSKTVCLSVGKESGGLTIRNCLDLKYTLCQV